MQDFKKETFVTILKYSLRIKIIDDFLKNT